MENGSEDHQDLLALTLSTRPSPPPSSLQQPTPLPSSPQPSIIGSLIQIPRTPSIPSYPNHQNHNGVYPQIPQVSQAPPLSPLPSYPNHVLARHPQIPQAPTLPSFSNHPFPTRTDLNLNNYNGIPQAPPLPSYPNHQIPAQIDLNLNNNGVFGELARHPLIPQAPPLPSYPNHQFPAQTDLNLNHNGVSREIVRPTSRLRRNPHQAPRQGKTETVPQPFLWATDQRAVVHSLEYLLSHDITTITGEVQCKKCGKNEFISYDLQEKFKEIADFIKERNLSLNHRAPSEWMSPNMPNCKNCGSSTKPVINKKKSINWLFLLLGQMLGCCKLSELKYFCKHTKNHRTGAKDRVLYLTYMGLCKQLDPNGDFDI